ncbi:MAG: IS630 family transposase [Planctomycetota bacterium]
MNVKTHHTSNQLLKMYRAESNPRLARRIHGVYLANKGHSCPEIMQIIGASRRAIQQWIHKYNNSGIEALKDKPRPGKPTTLPGHMEQKFCRRMAKGPLKQDGVSVLNGPAIKRLLEREFGVVYSLRGVYDLLHRLGYSCLCPRSRHEKADPGAQQEFKKTSLKGWMKSNQNTQARK